MGDILKISLASARVNANLTQEEVCKVLNISKKTLGSWENGNSEPKISQALDLAELYHCNVNNIAFARA